MSSDPDDLRNIPGVDPVHSLILRKVEMLESKYVEMDRWRTKVDIMLENVAHLEARFDAAMERQTGQILAELSTVKTDLSGVLKDQAFWSASRTIAQWIIITSSTIAAGIWAIFTFVYDHHGHQK